jgi:hypothetical protein
MKERIRCYSANELRAAFLEYGLSLGDTEKAINDYMAYREQELANIIGPASILSFGAEALAEGVMENFKDGFEIVTQLLDRYLRYANYKKSIEEAYQNSKSWDEVITTAVYSDVNESQEAFIDYVEETYQTKVKDAKHLQELTGITQKTLNGLVEIVTSSRYSKYGRALVNALQYGAKYKDLLQIQPQEFSLPDTWSGQLATDQYSSILWAIEEVFTVGEIRTIRPDLKTIAQEIEAPYSVLMDVHKICN